ncbi:hypothetical protein [Demequina sp.]|uniref:hypothetical protein n=1 Tax=Demequina sp. TaxID=2050685 RepID=UPI003A8A35FD
MDKRTLWTVTGALGIIAIGGTVALADSFQADQRDGGPAVQLDYVENTDGLTATVSPTLSAVTPVSAVSVKSTVTPVTPVSVATPAAAPTAVSARTVVTPITPVSAKTVVSAKTPVSATTVASATTPVSAASAN